MRGHVRPFRGDILPLSAGRHAPRGQRALLAEGQCGGAVGYRSPDDVSEVTKVPKHERLGVATTILALCLGLVAVVGAAHAQIPLIGKAWVRHTVDDSSRGADGVRLADVNGDGLLDVTTGWEEGGVVRVCINPGHEKAKLKWPAVTVGRVRSVEDAVFLDVDRDGAIDVVSCCEGKVRTMFVHWAPKRREDYLNPSKWETQAIPASQNKMMWMFCAPVDIDGDGDMDIFAGGKQQGAEIGWWELPENPRNLDAWRWLPLRKVGWIMSLIAADMDADGDADLLASDRKGPARGCFWLENPGGKRAAEQPWREHAIGAQGREIMFITLADLDDDGLQDVLAAVRPREIWWFKRADKSGEKWSTQVITLPEATGTTKAVCVGDINGDGVKDIVATCEQAKGELLGTVWVSFQDAQNKQWVAHNISGGEGIKYDLVKLIDLDGDGDLDVLTCEEAANLGVFWYENPLH